MPSQEALKYSELKNAVLQRFQITPEVHRLRFTNLEKSTGVSHSEYVRKMCDLMRKQVKGKEAEDYNQLFHVLAQEYFLSICVGIFTL